MRRLSHIVATGLLLASGGCYFGPRAATYGPARSAQGIRVQINGDLNAELLVVSDTALLVRRVIPSQLVFVPYGMVRSMTFRQNSALNYGPVRVGGVPRPETRAQWRLVARYPQGLTAEQVQELLRRMGQSSLEGP
jgi:hypothetical protein